MKFEPSEIARIGLSIPYSQKGNFNIEVDSISVICGELAYLKGKPRSKIFKKL